VYSTTALRLQPTLVPTEPSTLALHSYGQAKPITTGANSFLCMRLWFGKNAETFASVVSMVGQRSDWRRESAAAMLFLVRTVCRTALRDTEAGTWVGHSSAYPTEAEKRPAMPPLFTRSVKHSYRLWKAVFMFLKMSELWTVDTEGGDMWLAVAQLRAFICDYNLYSSLWSATDCTLHTSGKTM